MEPLEPRCLDPYINWAKECCEMYPILRRLHDSLLEGYPYVAHHACSYPNMVRNSRCLEPKNHQNQNCKNDKTAKITEHVWSSSPLLSFLRALLSKNSGNGLFPWLWAIFGRQVALVAAGCAQNLQPSSSNCWRMRSSLGNFPSSWEPMDYQSHRIHGAGIYANIGGILMVNVTIYSIHGSYGNGYQWWIIGGFMGIHDYWWWEK